MVAGMSVGRLSERRRLADDSAATRAAVGLAGAFAGGDAGGPRDGAP